MIKTFIIIVISGIIFSGCAIAKVNPYFTCTTSNWNLLEHESNILTEEVNILSDLYNQQCYDDKMDLDVKNVCFYSEKKLKNINNIKRDLTLLKERAQNVVNKWYSLSNNCHNQNKNYAYKNYKEMNALINNNIESLIKNNIPKCKKDIKEEINDYCSHSIVKF